VFRPRFFFASVMALIIALGSLARADDMNAFLRESQRFTAMRSFKLQINTTTPHGSSSKYLTYVAPNKLRIDVPTEKLAVVVIGTLVWVRGSDGKWSKQKLAPGSDPLGAVHDTSVIAKQVKGATVTFVRNEQLGTVPTHVYKLQPPQKRGYRAKTTQIWIGTTDGFPRKIVQQNGPFSSTATYTDLNGALSISGP